MANYFLTNKAIDDLSNIWEYTLAEWSEAQADKYYGLLIETFEQLSLLPTIGKKYEGIRNELLGFRVGMHIIFYQEMSPNKIEIFRILHERMDLKNRLGV